MKDKRDIKSDYEEQLAETLRNAILNNDHKWEKRWNSFNLIPKNGNTGRPYTGINELNLYFSPYTDPRWFTYKQIQNLGGQVKKGEKGKLIQVYTNQIEKVIKYENGNTILNSDGKSKKEIQQLDHYIAKYYVVFNAEQTTGLPPFIPPEISEEDIRKRDLYNIDRIENLVRNLNVTVEERFSNSAYYQPDKDLIVIPDKSQFKGKKEFYGTLLHEASHATSHPTRLNREVSFNRNSKAYAKEELIAEVSSMLLSRKYQIAVQNIKRDISDEKNSIAYLKGWLEAGKLTNDDFKDAIKTAVKVSNYIALHDKELTQNKSVQVNDKVEERKQQILKFVNTAYKKINLPHPAEKYQQLREKLTEKTKGQSPEITR